MQEQAIEMNAMHGQQLNGLFGMLGRNSGQRPNHLCLRRAPLPIERSWMRQPGCQTDMASIKRDSAFRRQDHFKALHSL